MVSGILALGLLGALGLWPHSPSSAQPIDQKFLSDPLPESGMQGERGATPSFTGRNSPGRQLRLSQGTEGGGNTQAAPPRILLRGRLMGMDKGLGPLGNLSLRIHLDGKEYRIRTGKDGRFELRAGETPGWTSLLMELPREEYFFPLAGIDWVDGPAYLAPLLAKARTGQELRLPLLPWAEVRVRLEGPRGLPLEQAKLFVRPQASPASLGKEAYRLPGRHRIQDPPLGPGIGQTLAPGLFLCPKLPPRLPLHLLALSAGGLRAETVLPNLSPGQRYETTLRLLPSTPPPVKRLWVVDRRGRPISGAKVWLYDQEERSFGRLLPKPSKGYPFSPPGGGGRIRAWAPGYFPGELPFSKGRDLPPKLQLQLRRGGRTLRIQVQKGGKPQEGVPLHLRELGDKPWALTWTLVTDPRGIAALRGLEAPSGLLLFFGSRGSLDFGLGENLVPDPPLLEIQSLDHVPRIAIEQGARIKGIIRGFRGDPRDLSLQAVFSGSHTKGPWRHPLFNIPLRGQTSKKGFSFFQQGLPRGEYRLRYRGHDLARFNLRPGESRLDLRFSIKQAK